MTEIEAPAAMYRVPKLGVTGHRPDKLGGYTERTERRLLRIAHDVLCKLEPQKVVLGMAQGWDMACATACIGLDIPFIAAVPFEGQEKLWPAEVISQYNSLLRRARWVHVCSKTQKYSAKLFQLRNEWIVDQSNVILACHDGTTGGTFNCLRYAAEQHVLCWNIYPRYRTELGL